MVKGFSLQTIHKTAPYGIFFVAFLLRIFYLFQFQDSPFFSFILGDGEGYLAWGKRIAGGEWLAEDVFYQAPLYPYFLGILQRMFGPDLWSIRLVQIFLGSLACAFLYQAGKSFFSPNIGLMAALLACFYAPALYFDGLIQKTGLGFFFMALALWRLGVALNHQRLRDWFVLGMVFGFFALVRENILLLVCVVGLWPCFKFKELTMKLRLLYVGSCFLGVMFALGPVSLHNWIVGETWALTTSQLGPNLYLGNNEHATGFAHALRAGRASYLYERNDAKHLAEIDIGRPLSPGEVSDYWLSRTFKFIKTQPGQWAKLTLKKWAILWNRYEVPDTDDYYIYHQWSFLLKLLDTLFHFGVLAPLAIIGCVFAWGMKRNHIDICYLLLISLVMSMLPFIIFGRYRFPLVPLLLLFAGCALVEGFRYFKQKNFRLLVRGGLVGLGMGILVHWPVFSPDLSLGYHNLALAYQTENQLSLAKESIETSIQANPNFAEAYNLRGNLHIASNQFESAIEDYSKAISLDPNLALAYNNRGIALVHLKQYPQALKDYEKAIHLNSRYAEAYYNRGIVYISLKEYSLAIGAFNQAIQLNPNYAEAFNNKGVAYSHQHQFLKAIENYNQAIRLDPQSSSAYNNRGISHAKQGIQKEEATHHTLLACTDWKKACELGSCQPYKSALQNSYCQK